jgi:hypothetical protein
MVSDFVLWPFTEINTFIVKSTYTMAKCNEVSMKCRSYGKGEPSNQEQSAKEWKTLWGITAHPRC